MRLVTTLMVAMVSIALWQAAAATTPAEPPSPTVAETPATAAPATQAATSNNSNTSTSQATTSSSSTSVTTDDGKLKLTAGDEEAAAQLKRFKAAGYKPEVHDGSVVFCRNETKTGSRFERRVCTTAHLLEQQMAAARDTLTTAQRNGTIVPR